MTDRFNAQQIIECLRSGISSRRLSAIFSYGREAALERVSREMGRVSEDNAVQSLVLKGNFGNGKTHFLNIIFDLAEKMNFAVSFVPLSKEIPFNRLDRIYRNAVAALYLPGFMQPGLLPLLSQDRSGSEDTEDIVKFASRQLHPKIAAVLKNYFESNDPWSKHQLFSDLSGDFIPGSLLKSIHRINTGITLNIPRFLLKEHIFDYFRMLSYLIKARGYAGWIILFDEFEQVMHLGVSARSAAYLNASRFMSKAFGLASTYTVFSASSNLWSELLLKEKRSDFDVIPDRLADKGFQHHIPTVKEVFGQFLRDNLFLDNLSSFDVRRLLHAISEYHSLAYSRQTPVDMEAVLNLLGGDTPLRTTIRSMVEYLDLQYLHGVEPKILVSRPEESAAVIKWTDDNGEDLDC
ncbi:MAG: ATP-binding protein [Actinobacteria bacterium]|nr:ATP-binding protein [Actinomycetota bacterium]